ncbi:maf protein [Alcanivorax jadensis T9]|jgi:MAF protein|uniref:7-methyl-GTP pyrophosphatase n=1 Tax=Alcanivorax jadensis T9 TaxID=1177181 RepID=A0ABR4WEH7_9GAMM|nr:nucleoside triphosphate pyrophosphatase [Alcanivorax jadensis]KGD61354.1 maf protein [Alcanivorax jadensis T9]MBP21157.1 septum formation inhibitor Maf [Alcanivorax sp.]|tara:strand:+ start:750 stop:1340 length:591 start_codon:yes stop_codon:yes gene_type:complete
MTDTPALLLASSSPFRRQLLDKLGLDFIHQSPDIDESPLADESPVALVMRLAREKAGALAGSHPDTLIIGSDQVAVIGDRVLGKPGTREKAIEQLSAASGQRVTFLTGLCLLNTATGRTQVACDPFHVQFRTLRPAQIERYVDAEQPLNCAGSFKSEGLGIVLFKAMEGRDPNTLVGLPLILLTEFLAAEGISLPL